MSVTSCWNTESTKELGAGHLRQQMSAQQLLAAPPKVRVLRALEHLGVLAEVPMAPKRKVSHERHGGNCVILRVEERMASVTRPDLEAVVHVFAPRASNQTVQLNRPPRRTLFNQPFWRSFIPRDIPCNPKSSSGSSSFLDTHIGHHTTTAAVVRETTVEPSMPSIHSLAELEPVLLVWCHYA